MYPSPQPGKQAPAPQYNEPAQNTSIGELVIMCAADIAKCHEAGFTDTSEIIDRLIKNPEGNLRTHFEALYIGSNLYILQLKPDLEIEHNKKKISFMDLSGDIEKWLTFKDYIGDPSPNRALREGIILFNLYVLMLTQMQLYDPKEV